MADLERKLADARGRVDLAREPYPRAGGEDHGRRPREWSERGTYSLLTGRRAGCLLDLGRGQADQSRRAALLSLRSKPGLSLAPLLSWSIGLEPASGVGWVVDGGPATGLDCGLPFAAGVVLLSLLFGRR